MSVLIDDGRLLPYYLTLVLRYYVLVERAIQRLCPC
jgi:hypothetical protein